MNGSVEKHADSTHEAALRFVRLDAGEPGAADEAARWLDERPENERAFQRVELAAALGKRLSADPDSPLHAAAAGAAHATPRRRPLGRLLAWSGALAALLLVAVSIVRDDGPPIPPSATEAARAVTFDAPRNPVVVLPAGVVVDASAVAVLPFSAVDAAAPAQRLERGVVDTLRTVPGLYVIADAAVSSYANTALSPSEIGVQLGARGIVDTRVEVVGSRVRVVARLREAATGATLWRADVDRPLGELRVMHAELADQIAAAMLDATLRPQRLRADGSSAPPGDSAKPLQQ